MHDRIYVDHAATTPLLPEVQEAMRPWFEAEFGNPSSLHAEGRKARQAIDVAREQVSSAIGCLFGEVTFTSGGSEAANLAIIGTALQAKESGSRRTKVLVSAAEHHCVLETAGVLQALGFKVVQIPVDSHARVEPDLLESLVGEDVLLISVMHANNELGSINRVSQIASIAKRSGALLHTDCVQTFGQLSLGLDSLGADMITLSGHKVYGPKGSGALVLRSGVKVKPLVRGGGQERELRGGTEAVSAIVGFGEATRHLVPTSPDARDAFWKTFSANCPVAYIQSVPDSLSCLPGHVHLRLPGIKIENLLIRLDRTGIAASSGAACSSGSLEPSHVLLAAGCTQQQANEGLRITFGRSQTADTGVEVANRLVECLLKITSESRQ